MTLTVREMAAAETDLIVEYFLNSTPEHLETLGVDPTRFPPAASWCERLRRECAQPGEQRSLLPVIWLSDGQPIGFSTSDKIIYGEQANMHLHVIDPGRRHQGIGAECVRRSVDLYFEKLRLKRLFCEPNAFNVAPNRTLQKVGFTGTGGYFCSGADLKAVASGDPSKKREIGGHDSIAPMGPSRLRLTKPVIAAVEGFAVAGGMELALWADMRVVAEDATFGIFCRRFGVPLIDLGTIRLPRLIGHSQAIDLILTGRPVGGPEALRMGLANRLVPKSETRAQAIALARQIAAFPQTCLRADRLSALRQWDLAEEDAIANEMRGGLAVIASGETLSGAARFASGAGRHGAFGAGGESSGG